MRFPAGSLGIGFGALGRDFTDCQDRFGEIVVAAGAAAYLPTDGTNVPDYLLAADDSGTEMQVCYGLLCEGPLPRFIRFSASPEVAACRCRAWCVLVWTLRKRTALASCFWRRPPA